MIIYCKNSKCPNFLKFDEPLEFSFGKFYKPISKKDLLCGGMCKEFCGFVSDEINSRATRTKLALCTKCKLSTCALECLWNKSGKCTRENILVDKNRGHWVCKCYSDKFISGHMDWSRFGQKKDMF